MWGAKVYTQVEHTYWQAEDLGSVSALWITVRGSFKSFPARLRMKCSLWPSCGCHVNPWVDVSMAVFELYLMRIFELILELILKTQGDSLHSGILFFSHNSNANNNIFGITNDYRFTKKWVMDEWIDELGPVFLLSPTIPRWSLETPKSCWLGLWGLMMTLLQRLMSWCMDI